MTHLPHWQLESIFPSLESPKLKRAKTSLEKQVKSLEGLFEQHAIESGKKASVTPTTLELLDSLLDKMNKAFRDYKDLSTYLYLITATDAFHDRARAELSRIQALAVRLSILATRFTAWIGRFNLKKLLRSKKALEHRFILEQAHLDAQHLMGPEAEELASSLLPSSAQAWSRLHDDLISRTTIMHQGKALTLTQLKNLQADARASIRKAAFESEYKLLAQNEVSFAAALNSLKGQVNELCRRRHWSSALDVSLNHNHISQKSLDAMHAACQEAFPMFRRYLKAKAHLLGKPRLDWFDLSAPAGKGKTRRYSWEAAQAFILEQFSQYSDTLAAFARRSFEEGWHDVPPRKGKTNGAFCTSLPGAKESRLMHNFSGTLDDLFTLAHELGHAYHNECMYRHKRSFLQMQIPATLAETASTFCETIVFNAILESSRPQEKLAILEQDLRGATALVVDIHSRFLFEKRVFEKRLERELSINELKHLMLEAQEKTYGTSLKQKHDLMWAHKGHYYIAGMDFYNYPYTFGYLFALGLYAEYQQQPQGFQKRYDRLLSESGMYDAKTLAESFGIDIEDICFWRNSLAVLEPRIREFEHLSKSTKYRV